MEPPPADSTDHPSIEYLRSRGVEVELPEDRAAKARIAGVADGPSFSFVHIPADGHAPVAKLESNSAAGMDVLPAMLGPCFATDEAMDPATVMRETSGRIKNMMLGGGAAAKGIRAPTAQEIQKQAAGGACEAYPLAQASEANGWRSVRLYIDEVGALRNRPRNRRAEDLAEAAGLAGLSIHGDAYVGRCERGETGEHNTSFSVDELAASSEWAMRAKQAHLQQAVAAGHGDDEHLAQGGVEGKYSWTQTDEDVEVRVKGAPEGKGAAKRVGVAYGRGESLVVSVDGAPLLSLVPLFARVTPDECSWTLDKGEVVVSLEKGEARPWTELVLPGH